MLEVRGLETGYGQRPVLRGIDFEVGDGEVVAILGANGAGKSTTLRCLAGLLPARRGKVVYCAQDITDAAPPDIVRKGIAMVPEGRQVFAHLTVLENLRLGAYIYKDEEAIRADLRKVYGMFPRLEEREKQSAGSLSGGEQQMLAMGRALMSRPKLLLLDEPSMGLSPILVAQTYATIADVHAAGTAVLVVEQNARMALKVADRAYVVEMGRITLSGTAEELQRNDGVRKAYLGEG